MGKAIPGRGNAGWAKTKKHVEENHSDRGTYCVEGLFGQKSGKIAWKAYTDKGGSLTLLAVVGNFKEFWAKK